MSRGNAGQSVFLEKEDYHKFLERIATLGEQLKVEVHAYILMRNHIHLFVRTQQANLSTFMQRLLSGHTTWHHCVHGTYGHLFQGRYKALVVENNAYGSEVSRYIHLNPVRAAEGTDKTVAQKQALLRDYPWSSYRAIIGLDEAGGGLVTKDTLDRYDGCRRERQKAYARFVEQGLLEKIDDPKEEARAQLVLGRDRFFDRIRRIMRGRAGGDKEAARMKRRVLSARLEEALARVAQAYKIDAEDLRVVKHGRVRREARQVALWLARRICGGAMTTRQIGKEMGGICGASVATADARLTRRILCEKRLKRLCERLLNS